MGFCGTFKLMLKIIVFLHELVVTEKTLTCFLITIFDFGTILQGALALFEPPFGAKGV